MAPGHQKLNRTDATYEKLFRRRCDAVSGSNQLKNIQEVLRFGIFEGYLLETFELLKNRGITLAYLAMDNVPFRNIEIIGNIFTAIAIRLYFLLPYSPCPNPIEILFSKWKLVIRQRNSINAEELIEPICITPSD
ncbi:hypothetical protein RF11_05159 [Thelohanellus kitauei]|uniref:Tc1-like transposase DDE domain-containing protein n=1 Tax=Thelohanellus kitauei TaxID=669202 RepID=A0A0C2MV23_THEKT|nr:hypothetical protein RF11_05159 [Thelohanellus kitauei]